MGTHCSFILVIIYNPYIGGLKTFVFFMGTWGFQG